RAGFDHDVLAPFLRKLLRDDAQQHVRRAARRERNDHANRTRRVIGRGGATLRGDAAPRSRDAEQKKRKADQAAHRHPYALGPGRGRGAYDRRIMRATDGAVRRLRLPRVAGLVLSAIAVPEGQRPHGRGYMRRLLTWGEPLLGSSEG